MSIQCPCCKALNEAGPECRRCKADLKLLFDLETWRLNQIAEAKAAAHRGDSVVAIEKMTAALACRNVPETRQLLAAIYLMAGNFPKALALHARGARV